MLADDDAGDVLAAADLAVRTLAAYLSVATRSGARREDVVGGQEAQRRCEEVRPKTAPQSESKRERKRRSEWWKTVSAGGQRSMDRDAGEGEGECGERSNSQRVSSRLAKMRMSCRAAAVAWQCSAAVPSSASLACPSVRAAIAGIASASAALLAC